MTLARKHKKSMRNVQLVERPFHRDAFQIAHTHIGPALYQVGRCLHLVKAEERSLALIEFRILPRLAAQIPGIVPRQVVVTPIENRPGSASAVLRRVAEAGANVDLLYTTPDGRLVLGGDDLHAIRYALDWP